MQLGSTETHISPLKAYAFPLELKQAVQIRLESNVWQLLALQIPIP
jgi:hypothetical protein